MLKEKKYIIVLIAIMVAIIMIKPNFSDATTEYKYSDTNQGIEWVYELDENNNVINLYCATKSVSGKVTIPSTIDGNSVVSLKGGWNEVYNPAFYNCKGLTEIVIPETITVIPECAFYNCVGLKSVVIPDKVTSIESNAFSNCTGLSQIELPNQLISIGESGFYNCSGIKTIIFPENLIEIQSNAFSGCAGIKKIEIPDSVTTIGSYAFSGCTGINELRLSNQLTKLSDGTFSNCSGLKEVKILDSVTTIGKNTFWGCTGLKKVLIPDSVVSIFDGSFHGDYELTIYGNDGMKSKEYAEANEINFDYIANWDKTDDGADVTPPSVEKIEVAYDSIKNCTKDTNKNMYIVSAGTTLTINVQFSEIVEGSVAPVFTIKFGDMDKIELNNGIIGGSIVSYAYTIKETDKGALTSVSLNGGDLKDAAGNEAVLTVPAIYVQYSTAECVYANGMTTVNPDNENKNDDKTNNSNKADNDNKSEDNNKNNENNDNNNNQSNNNQNNSNTNDNTTAKGELPHTGTRMGIIIVIAVVVALCVIGRSKYNKLRDI